MCVEANEMVYWSSDSTAKTFLLIKTIGGFVEQFLNSPILRKLLKIMYIVTDFVLSIMRIGNWKSNCNKYFNSIIIYKGKS
jgi:hypothetical protein